MTSNKKVISWWHKARFDKAFFISIMIIVLLGFLIFVSAALGLQARASGSVYRIIINQAIFGLIGGSLVGTVAYFIPLEKIKDHAVPLFILACGFTLAVFIPGLGFSYGGATRWLDLGILTVQPAEFLKIASVTLAAAWFSFLKHDTGNLKLGLGGLLGIIAVSATVLILQPDTGTIMVIIASVGSVYLVAGGKWRHIGLLLLLGAICLSLLVTVRPYIKDRITTYLNPASDPLGAGYQTQQSLIAVGSGSYFGRGPGQSIQKFNYLPEPISDSIFAVFAEEYGFVGSIILVIIYTFIAITGLRIAYYLKNDFKKLLVVGLVTMIIIQSILNIGAMIGLFPLSGMPLIFVSHGGSALMFSLLSVGLILQASKSIPTKHRLLT